MLLAAEVARLTVSFAVADDNPALAIRLAPAAPSALASTAMAQVGAAAARGTNPDDSTFRQLRMVATSDPLRTEPFLVEAALAERGGAYGRAKQLLVQARSRDPRSAAARYLYADTSVRQGQVVDGLKEMAVLTRLVPGAAIQLVPALAQYARAPGSHEKLAGILVQNPQLKNPLLIALATNPENADLIISLAGTVKAPGLDTREWQTRLLQGMIAKNSYQRAYDFWRRFALLPRGEPPLLFNGSFRDLVAPPPFNWTLSSSSAGVAEPEKGRLRILYYGRQDANLATQLLMLRPGRYRFVAPFVGDVQAGALSWSINCVGETLPFVDFQLGAPSSRVEFTVPSTNCVAQTLSLDGHQQDSPQQSDIQIGPVSIERIGS